MGEDETDFDIALSAVEGMQTVDELDDTLLSLKELYGVANLGYHVLRFDGISRPELPIRGTCDPAWIKLYREREFVEIDPVAKLSWLRNTPIDWAAIDRSSVDSERFFARMNAFGVGRNGMGIPIHGAQGDTAIFTFTSHLSDDVKWRVFRRRVKPELSLIAVYMHEKVSEFLNGSRTSSLSRQERNCLQLYASGHNAVAIAHLAGISVHTVRMHLRNAQKRLGAHSKAEALAKAVSLGLIRSRRAAVLATGLHTALHIASQVDAVLPFVG